MAAAAKGWEVERMPVLDRSILRLATYELIAEPEVPVAVVIDEAVELAKQYSTEFSGGFVNGVLSTIARQVRDLTQAGPSRAPASVAAVVAWRRRP